MSPKYSDLWKQFLTWFLANVLGFAALGLLVVAFPFLMRIPGMVVPFLLIGLPVGYAQWLGLRRIMPTSIAWLFSIPIGILLAFLITRLVPDGFWLGLDDESIAGLTAAYLVVGFAIGLPQWLILRPQVARSSIWLLGSSLAVGASFWLILATDLVNQSGVLAYIVGALVYSTVTGLVLAGLLAASAQSQARMRTPADHPLGRTEAAGEVNPITR